MLEFLPLPGRASNARVIIVNLRRNLLVVGKAKDVREGREREKTAATEKSTHLLAPRQQSEYNTPGKNSPSAGRKSR
jgi:hypothetical protein